MPTPSTPTVTDEQAEQVLALISTTFAAYWNNCAPDELPTVERRDGRVTICWESGSPFEWAYLFPGGGHDEEMALLASDFISDADGIARVGHVDAVTLPKGVAVEAVDSFAIALYPDN